MRRASRPGLLRVSRRSASITTRGRPLANARGSNNQHAVAVRIESVSGIYRVLIARENEFAPGECAHEHQQTGLREVKVGEHRAVSLKLKAGPNEKVGFSVPAENHAFHATDPRAARANTPL